MKKRFYIVAVALLSIISAFWSNYDIASLTEGIFPRYVLGEVEILGKNTGKGNVIALSPYLHTYDFSSKEAFYNMLHYYFTFAQRKKLLNDSTIIVLPEYLGTWLVIANEKRSIYRDTSINEAMQTLVLSNLGKFGVAYLSSGSEDKSKEAVFRMKAGKMLEIYQSVFSKLAKEYHVTIVAGSIVLPNPSVKNGSIDIEKNGRLYNISVVFNKEGKVLSPLTKKIFPINEEKTFTSSAENKEVPVYKTVAGNFAVLICADSWYPSSYQLLKNKKVDILIVPSFVSGNDAWSAKWKGYNGAPAPNDIDKNDLGNISEQDAWLKYAMTGRIKSADIKTGINVFLRGDLWNLGTDGQTLLWNKNTPLLSKDIKDKTGSLINVWLE